jgi:hypothetical protein
MGANQLGMFSPGGESHRPGVFLDDDVSEDALSSRVIRTAVVFGLLGVQLLGVFFPQIVLAQSAPRGRPDS